MVAKRGVKRLAIRKMQMVKRRIDWTWSRDAVMGTVGFSLLLGVIGPYGDYVALDLGLRLLVWGLFGFVGFAVHAALLFLLERLRPAWPWLGQQLLTALTGAALLTPIVLLIDQEAIVNKTVDWVATYPMVLAISVLYLALYEFLRVFRQSRTATARTATDDEGPSNPSTSQDPRIRKRLPVHLEGAIICLAKEDHYLRVYTTDGNTLIRLRMSDALDELEPLVGLQTHRSWWISSQAVASARRRASGGGEAVLTNGLTVPIARARLQDAVDAGWFDRR